MLRALAVPPREVFVSLCDKPAGQNAGTPSKDGVGTAQGSVASEKSLVVIETAAQGHDLCLGCTLSQGLGPGWRFLLALHIPPRSPCRAPESGGAHAEVRIGGAEFRCG